MSKPYDFVPFLPCKPYTAPGNLYGTIKIRLRVITPLHISSGQLDEENGELFKRFIRVNGNLIIPGTSLKGCARNIAEAVSYSCYRPSFKINVNAIPVIKKHQGYDKCIICRMFGAMGYKSRVLFHDLSLSTKDQTQIIKIPTMYEPNTNDSQYYDKNKYKGYKFYYHGIESITEKGAMPYEFVSTGAEFSGEVIFSNLTEEQVNLLCFSLGLGDNIDLKLGYGKPAYYGSVKIDSDDNQWRERANKYKNHSDPNIQSNVQKLIQILDINNGKKVSDWSTNNSGVRCY